jgi:hypothetical protein
MCTSSEEVTSEDTATSASNNTPTEHVCDHSPEEQASDGHVCACKNLLPWRRWHVSLGFLLIGFLALHLSICVTAYRPDLYQLQVNRLHQLLNIFPWLFVPALIVILAIQFITGSYLLFRHGLRYQVKSCNRGGQLRFFLQRNSALLVGIFLLFHIGTLCRWGLHAAYHLTHLPLLSRYAAHGLFNPKHAFSSTAYGFTQAWSAGVPQSLGNRLCLGLILLGVLATAYHITNGMLSGDHVLKISKTPFQKNIWAAFSLAAGTLILCLAVLAWNVFARAA